MSVSPVLTLDTVTRREAGSYQCRADNGVGPPQFKKIDLLISCKLLSSLCELRSFDSLSPLLHLKNSYDVYEKDQCKCWCQFGVVRLCSMSLLRPSITWEPGPAQQHTVIPYITSIKYADPATQHSAAVLATRE